jgi:hypothetical protein
MVFISYIYHTHLHLTGVPLLPCVQGEASPSDLGFALTTVSGGQCTAAKDTFAGKYDNSLSELSAAELTRRIVQYRETAAERRWPGSTWEDMQSIMYGAGAGAEAGTGAGAAGESLFPAAPWGGMAADTSIFVQSALNMTGVQAASQGEWRIFSKLGKIKFNKSLIGYIYYIYYIYVCCDLNL